MRAFVRSLLCSSFAFGYRPLRDGESSTPDVAFVEGVDASSLEHLIMVPGHAVTITESLDGADSRDENWFLYDYQKGKDVPKSIVGHIRGGLDKLHDDRAGLVLFSGEDSICSRSAAATSAWHVNRHHDLRLTREIPGITYSTIFTCRPNPRADQRTDDTP